MLFHTAICDVDTVLVYCILYYKTYKYIIQFMWQTAWYISYILYSNIFICLVIFEVAIHIIYALINCLLLFLLFLFAYSDEWVSAAKIEIIIHAWSISQQCALLPTSTGRRGLPPPVQGKRQVLSQSCSRQAYTQTHTQYTHTQAYTHARATSITPNKWDLTRPQNSNNNNHSM